MSVVWTGPLVAGTMLEIARGTQAQACEIAARAHPEDVDKANGFASELGGWDVVAVRFPDLLACAQDDGEMTPGRAAALLGITAMCRALGHELHC